MKLFEKLKELYNNEQSKKKLLNLITMLCLGVIIVIGASTFTDKEETEQELTYINDNEDHVEEEKNNIIKNYSNELESKLEYILGKINGVGNVNVMITLEDTAERIPAVNTTQSKETTSEEDSQGGVREVIKQDSTQQIVVGSNKKDSILVIKEIKPEVKGVIVVAEGAEDINVKEKLYKAVKTVLGINGNRVEIYSSN